MRLAFKFIQQKRCCFYSAPFNERISPKIIHAVFYTQSNSRIFLTFFKAKHIFNRKM